jgi:hypothetical protein
MALSYLGLSVTQGGADAFAISAAFDTGLSGQTQRAYRVRELLFEFPRPSAGAITNTNQELALCRRTKTAMPVITDKDVIAKVAWRVEIATSGAYLLDAVKRSAFTEDDELLIVEDSLYLAIDSNATTLTSTAYCRIGYELVNISAVDRLTLLTQSLQ